MTRPNLIIINIESARVLSAEFDPVPMGEAVARFVRDAKKIGRIPTDAPSDLTSDARACYRRLAEIAHLDVDEVCHDA